MASGLISLAYMIETAIVFNLAYVELTKGRYVKIPAAAIDKLHKRIQEEEVVNPDNSPAMIKDKTKILDRLKDMTSPIPANRQASWVVKVGQGDSQTQRNFARYACEVYRFFDRSKDKTIAEHLLIIASLLLVGITIFDHLHVEKFTGGMLVAAVVVAVALVVWFFHVVCDKLPTWLARTTAFVGGVAFPGAYAANIELPFLPPQGLDAWWYFFSMLMAVVLAPVVFIIIGRRLREIQELAMDDAHKDFEALKARPIDKALAID